MRRVVSAAAITSGQAVSTPASANVTAAGQNACIAINGAGASGAALTAYIKTVTNALTVTLTSDASTAVNAAMGYIGILTTDGVRPETAVHIERERAPVLRLRPWHRRRN